MRTAEYRASSDALGRFLDERTQSNPNAVENARELFSAWCVWCRDSGEEPGSEVAFAEAMSRRGFDKKRRSGGRFYVGLLMLAQPGANP